MKDDSMLKTEAKQNEMPGQQDVYPEQQDVQPERQDAQPEREQFAQPEREQFSYSVARDVTIMALVVSCNVALELSLGTALHAVNFPLTGSVMVVLNAFAYALAFSYCPRFGRVSVMGIATGVVALILGGGFKLTMLPSIIGEAVLVDVILSRLGLSKLGFVLCGACASASTLGFKLFNMQVFRGIPVNQALLKIADLVPGDGGMVTILVTIILYRLVGGALFAWMIWGALVRLRGMLYPQGHSHGQ